jgi:hypothetical protein
MATVWGQKGDPGPNVDDERLPPLSVVNGSNRRFSMTDITPALTRHDLEAKIVKRCWQDEGFRKKFVADPGDAFAKYLKVPADRLPKILVHEETAGFWHIVIPEKPPSTIELSDEELEKVAGGGTDTPSWGLGSAVSLVTMSLNESPPW